MHFYNAFGLRIQSEIRIPQFLPAPEGPTDISIKFGSVRSLLRKAIGEDRAVQTRESEICFFWEMAGHYCARDGNEIIVESSENVDEKILRIPIIGVVLAAILKQRDMLVLHASAVAAVGGVSVFLGWKGAGKSTTAAMMYGRGCALVSDDIVAIPAPLAGAPLVVLPGFPSFKLMPESVSWTLGDDPSSLDPLYAGAVKRFRSTNDNFMNEPKPLRRIYVLEESEEIKATLLDPQPAISALIANTYLARFGKQLLQNCDAITNLRQVAKIANVIPVYRLERPKSFALLDHFADFLESHQTKADCEQLYSYE